MHSLVTGLRPVTHCKAGSACRLNLRRFLSKNRGSASAAVRSWAEPRNENAALISRFVDTDEDEPSTTGQPPEVSQTGGRSHRGRRRRRGRGVLLGRKHQSRFEKCGKE